MTYPPERTAYNKHVLQYEKYTILGIVALTSGTSLLQTY